MTANRHRVTEPPDHPGWPLKASPEHPAATGKGSPALVVAL